MRTILLVTLYIIVHSVAAQNIRLRGNVKDTGATAGLPNAVLMALKFKDSSLVAFSRTDAGGILKPVEVPKDTYLVIIAHPSFGDRTFFLLPGEKDTAFIFRNIVLPPKSVALKEVEILAYRDKIYYKGDTLMFTADSFKTAPNATVEDLLKKLPGFKVDNEGKITIQGKKVDQVLVDGDEFFGSDPTTATRNLNATSIENVQVYEKKNESTDEGASETVQVLNLQMKDDTKKGYFGKASAAGDFQKYYESQLLLNRFKVKRKISVFGMAANTPRQGFSGSDVWKYGLQGEQRYSYDEESGNWSEANSRGTGVPRTIKGGVYFNDSWGKNTKVNGNYTYNLNNLRQGSEQNVQNFLQDTAFSTKRIGSNDMRNEGHVFNAMITQKLDSLTEFSFLPKYKRSDTKTSSVQTDDFFSEDNINTRRTEVSRSSTTTAEDASFQVKLKKNFMKKDRQFNLSYLPSFSRTDNQTDLNTKSTYNLPDLSDTELSQKRIYDSEKNQQDVILNYVEPFSKKFKTDFTLSYSESMLGTNRNTYDLGNGKYDFLNTAQSNSFQNTRKTGKGTVKFIYDVRKYRISVGTSVRNIRQENFNRTTGLKLRQQQTIPLPLANFTYKIGQNSNIQVHYNGSSTLPDLQQMQPVIDNSDPNHLSTGTPSLLPTFDNNINANYYFYKGISDVSLWSGLSFGNTYRQFGSYTTYDDLGRSLTQQVNVNGSYNASFYIGGHFPLAKKWLKVESTANIYTNQNINYINKQINKTINTGFNPELGLNRYSEKFQAGISGSYNYNTTSSSISARSSQPYYSWSLRADFLFRLKKGLFVSSDARYNNNGNRSPGYNLNYTIWNASVGKSFLKTENLTVSLNAYDLLNQNISNERSINGNQITDNKTAVIKRYFLLRLQLKFNNQKTKVEEDEWD